MLEEYKKSYEEYLQDPQLKQKDKNDLIKLYVETNEEKYLAAAIYKFWYILNNKINNNRNNKFVEPEDFYGMYIDSIIVTCENRLWCNKEHSLYNDKKAPEKSINTIFNSKIINYFHACNRQKRKSSFEKVSLTEYNSQDMFSSFELEEALNKKELKKLIVELFEKKDYYSSYILDMILHYNLFDRKDNKLIFSKKRLKHYLMKIDNEYCYYFSNAYDVDLDKVLYSLKYVQNMSYDFAEKKINSSLKSLYHNDKLIKFLKR